MARCSRRPVPDLDADLQSMLHAAWHSDLRKFFVNQIGLPGWLSDALRTAEELNNGFSGVGNVASRVSRAVSPRLEHEPERVGGDDTEVGDGVFNRENEEQYVTWLMTV